MSELKQEHKRKIVNQLEKEIGRPSTSMRETRLRAATAEVLSGTPMAEAQRMYAVQQGDLDRFIKQVFPTDTDRYEFLEQCMLTNSMLAMARFHEVYKEMDAIDAARAATLFAGKAVDIRKARTEGFREQPISIGAIITLEKTLKLLTQSNPTITDV